ncbi:hypothetical protein VQ042_18130 [Aurantimonas sp. A2-1-M11]|uniref:hypothetical protein n=1 Tax=Aurantimonas sp. A2-1-M11 TaxID=3113712 RepID=UPI002F95262F
MTPKRYVLAKPGEALPIRGRLFKAEGEMMDPDDAFTRRLVAEGCIKAAPKHSAEPAKDDGGSTTKRRRSEGEK